MAKKRNGKPEKFDDGLTVRQRRFAEAYTGNGVEAAQLAGYTGSKATLAVTAYHTLRHPKVRELIAKRDDGVLNSLRLNREERQELWSRMAVDPDLDAAARLRASELLGKSEADFTEKLEVKGELTLEMLVMASRKP